LKGLKTGGLRPASRLPFYPSGNKKEAKSALPLRGAYCHAGKEQANNPSAVPLRQQFLCAARLPKVVAETIGPTLFPAVIEGAVGFKTNNAYATSLRFPLSSLAKSAW
jgi:hypothetical protein